MEKITGNEPAFPFEVHEGVLNCTGLTIRQYYAGLAMQGLVSQQAPVDRILNEGNQSLTKQIAAASLVLADALIAEFNSKG